MVNNNMDNASDYSGNWDVVENSKQPGKPEHRLPPSTPTKTNDNAKEPVQKLHRPSGDRLLKCVRKNLLMILMVIGVLSGIILGFILRASRKKEWTQREQIYVKFIGDLFLRMLQALILPLIVSSLISAVGSLDLSLSKTIGGRALAYYLFTTVCAVVLGIVLVIAIQPGKASKANTTEKPQMQSNIVIADTLMDLVRNMFPPNIVQAALSQYKTILKAPSDASLRNRTIPVAEYGMDSEYVQGTNIMGLVIFSTVFGITLGKMGEDGKPLLDFFTSISKAMIIITNWVVWLSPVGICFLIAAQLVGAKDIAQNFEKLGLYFTTVVLGLFIHGFLVLPLVFGLVTRQLPFKFMGHMTQALITAFGTSSSSATLPVTIGCLENKAGVDPRVSRFLLPIGATVNMDGTALYEAVATIFIAQMEGHPLSIGTIIAIVITATAASIGAAGIPQAGVITMVMVLNCVGLSPEHIHYIMPVDWLLDRFRTTVNVLGDAFGAGLVHAISKKELEKIPSVLVEIPSELEKVLMGTTGPEPSVETQDNVDGTPGEGNLHPTTIWSIPEIQE